jgi:hypothetical protein
MKKHLNTLTGADRKVLHLASAIFMSVTWLMMVALLVYWFVLWPTPAMFLYVWFDVLCLFFIVPLVLIPIQVVRYFRGRRQ